MAIYNAERYIADFIKTIIEDGLDEGQDVVHLDEKSFIDNDNDVITRPTMEEAMAVNKHFIASILADHLHEVFISSYKEYLKLELEREIREKKEQERLKKSPAFIRGMNDGRCSAPIADHYSTDYVKGYYAGVEECEEGGK